MKGVIPGNTSTENGKEFTLLQHQGRAFICEGRHTTDICVVTKNQLQISPKPPSASLPRVQPHPAEPGHPHVGSQHTKPSLLKSGYGASGGKEAFQRNLKEGGIGSDTTLKAAEENLGKTSSEGACLTSGNSKTWSSPGMGCSQDHPCGHTHVEGH